MSEWIDSDSDKENEDFQPLKKRQKKQDRFSEIVSGKELEGISKGFTPQNTAKNTKWAISTFQQWIYSRNQRTTAGETINPNILCAPVDADCKELCRALCLFVLEARKTNGEPYPAKTVDHLLAGLLQYARSVQSTFPNFLDPKDARFKKLQGTMDTHFRHLRSDGIGAAVKHACVISADKEKLLWELGILGTSSPLALLGSVFYYNGIFFFASEVEMSTAS